MNFYFNIFRIFFFLLPKIIFSQVSNDAIAFHLNCPKYSRSSIDYTDSLVFDLSATYQITSLINVPVYFHSDEPVYAIDFALKFNHLKASFDSVQVNVNSLQYLSYFNLQDSTLRFTSNNLTPLDADSIIVSLHFTVHNGPFCSGDLTDIESLLNGNACSFQVNNCVITSEPVRENASSPVVFPVPASGWLNFKAPRNGHISIYNREGKLMSADVFLESGQLYAIDISEYINGIYFIQFQSDKALFNMKFSVVN